MEPNEDENKNKKKDSTHSSQVEYDWMQRAACMSFIGTTKKYNWWRDEAFEVAAACVKNPREQVQHAVGLLLRDLYKVERQRVMTFIRTHYSALSEEALHCAIAKMAVQRQREFLAYTPQQQEEAKKEAENSSHTETQRRPVTRAMKRTWQCFGRFGS